MLRQRVLSAACMLVIFIVINFLVTDSVFALAMSVLAAVAAWEWSRLAGVRQTVLQAIYALLCLLFSLCLVLFIPPPALFGFASKGFALAVLLFWLAVVFVLHRYPEKAKVSDRIDLASLITGLLLIGACVYFSHVLHTDSLGGSAFLFLYAMCTVWVMDIGAYFAGRQFGRHKLAPKISPGKTWEGVVGGIVCAILLAALVLQYADFAAQRKSALILGTVLAAACSILGDLYESRLKRAADVKDSSQLIPGHGGVLDRIDGVIAAIPVFAFAWIWL